jgi:HTH-type transcriptional regulator / antitoxin HigA
MTYIPNKAIHPGYTLAKALEREGMTQKNLCARTGLSEKHLSQIINGIASITVETALLLENALGGAASFWLNLEKNYQETRARLERVSLVKKETGMVKKFFYTELVKRGYVPYTSSIENKVENLWKFFGVNSLSFIANTEPIAFRKKDGVEIKEEGIATWLRCGEIESKKVALPEYSAKKLQQALSKIKLLSVKKPEEFSTEIKQTLNLCGVSLVYIPHFSGIGVSGATRWINNNPLIQLSIYYSWADIFWFNLYHEIGHLLLHGKKEKFIEFDNRDLIAAKDKEDEADKFASNELIPEISYREFVKYSLTISGIIEFAKNLGIHPGIVAGRLCHDKRADWSKVTNLRSRLKFTGTNN